MKINNIEINFCFEKTDLTGFSKTVLEYKGFYVSYSFGIKNLGRIRIEIKKDKIVELLEKESEKIKPKVDKKFKDLFFSDTWYYIKKLFEGTK